MPSTASDVPTIGPVPPEDYAPVLRLLCRHAASDYRDEQMRTTLDGLAAGEISPRGLLGAYRGKRLTGGVFAQTQPGRAALVWTPRTIAGEPDSTADRLLLAAIDRLVAEQVCLAQVLLETGMEDDERFLYRHGFQHLADLLYMVSPENEFPTALPDTSLKFEPYTRTNHERLAHVVEASYRQTLDCPLLDGVRQIEDVLAGYRALGTFDPSRWMLVQHEDRDVGCLLLTDHPEHGNWELIYMGVMAPERGHGWGKEITRRAQWMTRQSGRPRLVLAVDAINEPAIRAYSLAGFRAWERRKACVKLLES